MLAKEIHETRVERHENDLGNKRRIEACRILTWIRSSQSTTWSFPSTRPSRVVELDSNFRNFAPSSIERREVGRERCRRAYSCAFPFHPALLARFALVPHQRERAPFRGTCLRRANINNNFVVCHAGINNAGAARSNGNWHRRFCESETRLFPAPTSSSEEPAGSRRAWEIRNS